MKKISLVFIAASVILAGTTAPVGAAGTPVERVAAYHQALIDGDIEAAKKMLALDLLLFEDGVAETSLKEYAGDHLKSDIAFSAKAKRKLLSQRSWVEGKTATVSSTYDVKAKFRGKSYHLKSAETMTLKQNEGEWIIVHIHWSNHQVKR